MSASFGASLIVAAGIFAASVPTPGSAADNPASSDAYRTYQNERSQCMNAPATEDQSACLKSAGAAYEEAKRGSLDVAPHPYDQNKIARCDPLPPDDKRDCISRMQGAGTVSGSVSEGGIYRELVTEQTAPAPDVAR